MNEVWNLDPIYKGFEDPAFEADMAKLKAAVAEINDFAAKLPFACVALIYGICIPVALGYLVFSKRRKP